MRLAFALPAEVEDRLAHDAVRHGHEIAAQCASAGELASRVEATKPDVAIVAATERHLTPQLVLVCDQAGVRILPLVASETDRRYAGLLELHETIEITAAWPEVESQLTVVPTRGDAHYELATEPSTEGMVVAVWGPAGSPGRTTLAINLAAELAASGRSVALADVDTYSGSIAPALGMLDESPGFAAACRLAGSGSLSREELERIGHRYGSGRDAFWVLTGLGRPSRWPELSSSKVATVLGACREWVDITVVDTGFSLENDDEIASDLFAPRRNAAGITALREADLVVAVGAADPVGLSRFLRAHVDLLETVPEGRVVVAMNKVRASAIGLNPVGQVAQTLARFGGIESAAMIPFDAPAMDAALLRGNTLADASPRSTVRSAIRDLALTRLVSARASRR